MKRLILSLVAALTVLTASGQENKGIWKKSLVTQFGFSQVSLTDWAAGGYGSISANAYFDGAMNYQKDKLIWNNGAKVGYGFIQNFGEGFKKSDDRLILDSKFGYQAAGKVYFSALFNFQSQFTTGYASTKGSAVVSNFLAPAYTSLGLGLDYNDSKGFALNFAPLTGKVVLVKDPDLRTKYGNAEDQFANWQLGAQMKMDAKAQVEGLTVATTLTLFSNYLDKPLNVKVNWDANITAQLTKYIAATLRTYLIYDDAIKFIPKVDADGNPVCDDNGKQILVPGLQFKEISSLSFTYTFGSK